MKALQRLGQLDTSCGGSSMDRYDDDVSTEGNVLISNVSDDALERAAGLTDGPAFT
jgi:hypothetical protein